MGGTYSERRGLVGCSEKALLVVKIGPLLLTAVVAQLACGQKTSWLSLTHDDWRESMLVDGFKWLMVVAEIEKKSRRKFRSECVSAVYFAGFVIDGEVVMLGISCSPVKLDATYRCCCRWVMCWSLVAEVK